MKTFLNSFSRKTLLSGAITTSLLIGGVISGSAMAAPANPNPVFETQPDGTTVTLRVRGDEHFNWTEDANGYTVVRHNGWYKYAKLNNGRLTHTDKVVGRDNPQAAGLQKRVLPSAAVRAQSAKTNPNSSSGTATPEAVLPVGNVKNLVVMIRFSNHTSRTLPSMGDVDILFNAVGGDPVLAPTGSIKDVYFENSYGQMTLNSDVYDWVTVSNTEQYYANGASGDSTLWQALREALDVLDQTVDFRDYDTDNDGVIDAIAFLHSGYGAEWGGTDADGTAQADRIWSHRWSIQNPPWTSQEGVQVSDYHISPALWDTSGSDIGRIGVIAHETGHFFGLPDLYDTNSNGSGIGSYGLMANSWDFNGSQLCPPHFSPWSKEQLGWISPTVITQSGEYTVDQAETNNSFYKITDGYPSGEYLVIENRQNAGFDCSMPQGGLAIWHIDEATGFNTEGYPGMPGAPWPTNGKHYQVALLQADGNYDMEKGVNRGDAGDVHHGGGVDAIGPGPGGHPNTDAYQSGNVIQVGHTISDVSNSGSSMTFCFNGCGGQSGLAAPTNLTASTQKVGKGKNAVTTVTLNWTDNSGNEDNFVIDRCEETGKGQNKVCNFAEHATVGANVTTFSESGLSGTFKYRVKARNAADGDSDYTNEVKI